MPHILSECPAPSAPLYAKPVSEPQIGDCSAKRMRDKRVVACKQIVNKIIIIDASHPFGMTSLLQ